MRKLLRKGVLAIIPVFVGSITGCGLPPADATSSGSANDQPTSVPVVKAEPSKMERSTTQPATVHAWFTARIFAQTTGYLSEIKVDIGSEVKAGDVLAKIDVPEVAKRREAQLAMIGQLEADEQRAAAEVVVGEANVGFHKAQWDRSKAEVGRADATLTAMRAEKSRVAQLVEQKAIADRLLDEVQKRFDAAEAEMASASAAVSASNAAWILAQAQVSAANADVKVAKAKTNVAHGELAELDELLNFAVLRSPFEGIVTERHVDPGDLVGRVPSGPSRDGLPLFVIARIDQLRVRVPVPERDAALVDVGDAVRITLPAAPAQNLEGSVARLAGVLDQQTRTMLVEVDLPNEERRLLPGMFGQATIILDPPSGRSTLPAGTIRYDEQGKSFIYVVNASDEIEVVPVQTGLDNGLNIEISSGLTGSERVVGPMLQRLKAGDKVRVE